MFAYEDLLVRQGIWLRGSDWLQRLSGCDGRLVTKRGVWLQRPFGYVSGLVTQAVLSQRPFDYKSCLVTQDAWLHRPFAYTSGSVTKAI